MAIFDFEPEVLRAEELALIKTSSLVWKSQGIALFFEVAFTQNQCEDFVGFCKIFFPKIEKEVSTFIIFNPCLKDRLLHILKISSLEIYFWIKAQMYLGLETPWRYIDRIKWTTTGKVNERETLKRLIQDGVPWANYIINASRAYCVKNLRQQPTFNAFIRMNSHAHAYFGSSYAVAPEDYYIDTFGELRTQTFVYLWNLLDKDARDRFGKLSQDQTSKDILCSLLARVPNRLHRAAFTKSSKLFLLSMFLDLKLMNHFENNFLNYVGFFDEESLLQLLTLCFLFIECPINATKCREMFLAALRYASAGLRVRLSRQDSLWKRLYLTNLLPCLFEKGRSDLYEPLRTFLFIQRNHMNTYFTFQDVGPVTQLLLVRGNLDKTQELLEYFMEDSLEIEVFKQNYAYLHFLQPSFALFVEGDLEKIDNILYFFFNNSEQNVVRFKKWYFHRRRDHYHELLDNVMVRLVRENIYIFKNLIHWISNNVKEFMENFFDRDENYYLILFHNLRVEPSHIDEFFKMRLGMNNEKLRLYKEDMLMRQITNQNGIYHTYSIQDPEAAGRMVEHLTNSRLSIVDEAIWYCEEDIADGSDVDLLYRALLRKMRSLNFEETRD